ncbi:MAG TPA: hypothetical protein VFP72_18205 [Kineosporiaceae bacterium]|nr:hypothetical protein [Kineosporiaceae bacterium]
MTWTRRLHADPLPWLLDGDTPAVRAAALTRLLDRPVDDPEVLQARAAAMAADPIRAILDSQLPEGCWAKPGAGYSPKYRATVWQVIFLDQLGADPADPRVQLGCEYVLTHTVATGGGMGSSGVRDELAPPPSRVIHCLNGNLVRALIGFGRLDDPRVQASIAWAARAITGEGVERYYASGTSGPGFACAANDGLPCAWGGIKELLGLARIPAPERDPLVTAAIDRGVAFLLSRDPLVADYPFPHRDSRPSSSWFKLGFPSGYVADVLQNLQVLAELGQAGDPRLEPALDWLVGLADTDGRWRNRYAYNGKTTVDFERQGEPSKWVTLRACTVLRAAETARDA